MRTVFLAGLGLALLASGCGPAAPSRPDPLEEVGPSAEHLQSEVSALRLAVDNLKTEMDRLDVENWKDVVPDVRLAAEDVDNQLDSVEGATDEVRSFASDITQMLEDEKNEARADSGRP